LIQFKALGGIALHGPSGPVERLPAQPKRLALLSWLALAIPRGPHRRDRVLALFWPEADEGHARNSLSQAIYHIRQELEPELLVGRGAETLAVDFGRLECDVLSFEEAVSAGRWADVRSLYGGDLLPGFHVSGAPDFERWLERERQRLSGMATDAAWRAAATAERAGDAASAVEAARWAVDLAPYDEEALRRLLAWLDRAGDRTGAIDAYENFAERLGREFGERPAPETTALLARVRARRASEPSIPTPPSTLAAPPVVTVPAPDARAPRPTRPLRRALLTAAAIAVAISPLLLWRRTARADAPPGRAIAIMPLTTHGDPALAYVGDGLGALLEAKLERAGGVRLVDPITVRALQQRESTVTADPAAALRAAQRLHATHFVVGDVTIVGEQVQVRAELRLTRGDGALVSTATVSGARDSLFRLADALALRLLVDAAGLDQRELQVVGAAATGSLDAFRAFIDGEAAMAAGRHAEAAERFAQAVSLDSGFAIAAYRGATALDWAGRPSRDIFAMLALAERGRRRLSDRQQRLLAAASAYYHQDGDSAERVLRDIVADDPDAIEAWFLLGESIFHLGPARGLDWRDARAPFERVMSFDPDDAETLLHLARIAAAEGDRSRLESLAERALPGLQGTVREWELAALRAYVSGDPARIATFRRGLASAPPGAAQEAARALAVYLEDLELATEVDRMGQAGRAGPLRMEFAAARGRWREAFGPDGWRACTPSTPLCADLHLLNASLPGVPAYPARESALVARVEGGLATKGSGSPDYEQLVHSLALGRYAAMRDQREQWAAARARLVMMAQATPELQVYPAWLDAIWLVQRGGPHAAADTLARMLQSAALRRRMLGTDVAWPGRLDAALALAVGRRDDPALALFRSVPDPSGRDLMFLPYARLGEARILAGRGERDAARRLYGHVLRMWRAADVEFQPYVATVRADSAALDR